MSDPKPPRFLKSMNKFVERSCAKKYPQIASAAALPAAKEPAAAKKEVKKAVKPAEPTK